MSEARTYAKSLAQLLDSVKAGVADVSLREDLVRVRGHARSQSLIVELTADGPLLLNGLHIDSKLWDVRSLVDAMRHHNIERITVLKGAVPKELLQLAVLLSKTVSGAENESSVFDDARDLSMWSVSLLPMQRASEPSVQIAQAAVLNLLKIDELAGSAEEVVRQVAVATSAQDAHEVLTGLSLLYLAETNSPEVERKSVWTGAFEKAATGSALQLAASLLPEAGTESDVLRAMLKRAGDSGAEALIALLPAANSVAKRRLYFDAIVDLGMGVPALINALNSAMWFVVRNAALLLGEMKVTVAERHLGRLLSHADERVRIAATSALAHMGTPSSHALVQSAIDDASSEMRRRAAGAFGLEQGSSVSASPLLRALTGEQNLEVQVEILYALGRVASADAVQKLIRLCSDTGAADRPASYRIAAIEALTAARRSASLSILRTMSSDSDPAVRATARNLIESVNAMAAVR